MSLVRDGIPVGSHQGQVGLPSALPGVADKVGFENPKVASLADSQLNQPRQAMLDHLSPTRVFGKILTLLEGPGLLQERFLRVESHRTAFALAAGNALVSQRAYATDRRVELKTLGPDRSDPTGWSGCPWYVACG